ncbi:hypothetical protein BCY86_07875 [Pajaroellobacter abortibovis]|uniref:Uncharacterized protein n=2 Tax=Pajaroellobacter abortibovis TaxID=1882918 RepID=A0A1L6MYU5_9BACT|nr:hypothetical protein BCY86_07875 [Pajaroellobacter abortibovis]
METDHIDIYPKQEAYETVFQQLIREVPEKGLLVYSRNANRLYEPVDQKAKARMVRSRPR